MSKFTTAERMPGWIHTNSNAARYRARHRPGLLPIYADASTRAVVAEAIDADPHHDYGVTVRPRDEDDPYVELGGEG